MSSARTTLAVAGAAAAGVLAVLTGLVGGSVITLIALAVAARAALAAVDPAATRTLARHVRLAPAWLALGVAASARAGSVSMEDIRGAHAVLGPAVTHGSVLAVAGALIAVAAGAAVTSVGTPAIVDRAAAALQIAVVVALFTGPQITDVLDIVPWTVGLVAIAAISLASERLTRWERSDAVLIAAAVAGAALSVAGARL